MSRLATFYVYMLAVLAVVIIAGWTFYHGISIGWTAFGIALGLFFVCLVVRRFPIQFDKNTVEVVDIAVLAALVILGPLWALFVALPSVIFRNRTRTIFMAAADGLTIMAAGYTFNFFSSPIVKDTQFGESFIYGALAASVVFYIANALINSLLMHLKYADPILQTLRRSFLPLIPSDVAAVLAALGAAYFMVAFGPAATLVLFVGAIGAVVSLHLIHTRQSENEALKARNSELLESIVGFASGVVESLGEKDGFTARLAAASSVYAGDVASEFGLDEDGINTLRVAALLQDVGFVGIPEEVALTGRDRLNPEGRRLMESHAALGERMLSKAPGFEDAAKWVRWHHERMDGSGFPDGLAGKWIPFESRILAAASSYASLVVGSPDSAGLEAQEARLSLTSSEIGLDGEVVRALLRVLDREDEDYATAGGETFAFTNPVAVVENGVSLRVVGDADST